MENRTETVNVENIFLWKVRNGDGKELKKQTFVRGRPVDDKDLPPEFPGWQSHDDCFAFFEQLGWTQNHCKLAKTALHAAVEEETKKRRQR